MWTIFFGLRHFVFNSKVNAAFFFLFLYSWGREFYEFSGTLSKICWKSKECKRFLVPPSTVGETWYQTRDAVGDFYGSNPILNSVRAAPLRQVDFDLFVIVVTEKEFSMKSNDFGSSNFLYSSGVSYSASEY